MSKFSITRGFTIGDSFLKFYTLSNNLRVSTYNLIQISYIMHIHLFWIVYNLFHYLFIFICVSVYLSVCLFDRRHWLSSHCNFNHCIYKTCSLLLCDNNFSHFTWFALKFFCRVVFCAEFLYDFDNCWCWGEFIL